MSANMQDNSTQSLSGMSASGGSIASGLRSRALGPAGRTRVVRASSYAGHGVTAPAFIGTLKNHAERQFAQGSCMFARKKTDSRDVAIIVDLPTLNNAMEEAAANAAEKLRLRGLSIPEEFMRSNTSAQKRQHDYSPAKSIYPLSLTDFLEDWAFVGYMLGTGTSTSMNTMQQPGFNYVNSSAYRAITLQLQGNTENVPNLWNNPGAGDRVGFIVKEIPMSENRYFQTQALTNGTSPVSTFVRIIPWCSNGSTMPFPPYCSNINPRGFPDKNTDRDFVTLKYVPQIAYAESADLPGITDINPRSRIRELTGAYLSFPSYEQGFYLQVGVCVRANAPADEPTRKSATLSQKKYQDLSHMSIVDIFLTPLGQFEERC